MRRQRFDTKVTYYEESDHKAACERDAERMGKLAAEWYREASREKLARSHKERLKGLRV